MKLVVGQAASQTDWNKLLRGEHRGSHHDDDYDFDDNDEHDFDLDKNDDYDDYNNDHHC